MEEDNNTQSSLPSTPLTPLTPSTQSSISVPLLYSTESEDGDIINAELELVNSNENLQNFNEQEQLKTKSNQELILDINKDSSLSAEEKRARIRDIMLGKFKNVEEIKVPDCTHYKKLCNKFHFTCCNKTYDCCRCHNQAGLCTNQINIDEISCVSCGFKQGPSTNCGRCNTKFSRSYCGICNIWSEKYIYHCEKCGLCRIGSLDKFIHCDNCQCCVKKPKTPDSPQHVCKISLSKKTQCLLCLETAETTSQYHLLVLECNHPVHAECQQLAFRNGNYKCPLCRKSMGNMQMLWANIDYEILVHPLPEEAKKKVNIVCYDCRLKTAGADWHLFGIKCGQCGSYNTSTE